MIDSPATPANNPDEPANVDYVRLVKFLVEPFLTSPDALRLDCEVSPRTGRILLRLAIEGEDKGKVFGRGGRNLQAIRSVVDAAAQLAGQLVHVEIYGQSSDRSEPPGRRERSSPPRPPIPRPRPQPRG
ncbi:MAG: KH domain-containing protein [Elainellaceae cyanobacterium]